MIRSEGHCTVCLHHNVPRTVFLFHLTIVTIVSPWERALHVSKEGHICDLNCNEGKDSLCCKKQRNSENNTVATSSKPWNLGNVTLPL